MAADTERMRLVIEARETASREIKRLRRELNALGGPPIIKAQGEIKKLNRQINQLSATGKKARPVWTKFTQGIALGNIAAMAAASAMGALRDAVRELGKAAMVAAQVEELGNVMMFIGQRAGYTAAELEGYRNELLRAGIAQKETNQGMLRAIQANISLADAVKFGRLAQDAAVVGLTESSEAYTRIIGSIAKLMPRQLKELGIIINLNNVYGKYAKEHGRVAAHLTETEKKTAMINAVQEKGEIVAGAYEEAMFNVSKRIRSLPRLYQDLQVALGEKFNPVLEVSVALAEELLLDLTRLADTGIDLNADEAKEDIVELREKARLFMATMVSMGETVYDAGSVIKNAIELTMLDPLIALGKVGEAVFTAMSHPWDVGAWKKAGGVLASAKDGFVDDFGEMEASLDRLLGDAATENLMMNAERIGGSMAKMRAQIGKEVEPIVTEMVTVPTVDIPTPLLNADEMEGYVNAFGGYMDDMGEIAMDTMGKARWEISALQDQIVGSAFAMGDAMVDGLMQGRIEFAQIFKGIAADFMKFFVRKALFSVLSTFIPGLGGMLGGMFDTPKYDKMAMGQGADFAEWFRKGVMENMGAVGTPLTAGGSRIAAAPFREGGQGIAPVTVHMTFSGNVMSPEFVEAQVAPALERLMADGRGALLLDRQNMTGDVDVRVD